MSNDIAMASINQSDRNLIMFTLKFVSFYSDGSYSERCVSCPHFEVYHRSSGLITVVAYKSFVADEGVEYRVAKAANDGKFKTKLMYHDACYIENSSGKTINHLQGKEMQFVEDPQEPIEPTPKEPAPVEPQGGGEKPPKNQV